MEVPKKRKRDVDCPRITYDTSTKVFDRLFKEESLEEMKNVVRKKLGLSSSLPVHLSQLRDGKLIVLEDDDDFDAFYASIQSTAVAKMKVYLGDDQPSRAGPDGDFTGRPMQLLGSPTIHDAAADDHSLSKKRKVAFVESTPQPVGDNVEESHSSKSLPNSEPPPEIPATLDAMSAEGDNAEEPHSTLPNSEPPPEVPVTLDVISADAEGAHETSVKTKKRKKGNTTGNTTGKKKKGRNEDPILEDQSLGEKVQSDIAVVTRKGQDESQRHTPSNGQVDPPGADVSTRPPKETKKNQVRMEITIVGRESNAALSAPISAISNNTVVVKRAKKQDSKPHASTSALQTIPSDSKGRTKKSGQSQHLTTSAKSTLRKTLTKKSRKEEAPVEPPEANDKDLALRSSATKAAVDAILGKFLSKSNDSRETAILSSPLVDATPPPPSIAPVASSSSPDGQPVPSNNTNTITEQSKTASKCPVCDKTPSHLRSRCPLIKAGIIAMRKRIVELQQNTPDGDDEEREMVIEELQRIIDKRTKRSQTRARGNKSTNVISMADKFDISPTLAADNSPAIEPPKTSQIVKPAKAPSLEDEPEVHDEPFRSQSRIPSSEVQEEGEEEEEASPFTRSIIPLPTRSASELLNEDNSSRSEDLQGNTSFHEVNDLGSSMEVDKTGDAAVNDAYALDVAHLSALKPSENGRKVVKTGSEKAPQSDPIEASEKPESSSPQSPIVSIEDDIHPPSRQSTPKADVAGRTGSQRISSRLVRKPTGLTFKPHNLASRTINGIRKNSKSTKKMGGLSRITDLSIPFISNTKLRSDKQWAVKRTYSESSDREAVHPVFDEEHEDYQQTAQAGEEGEEADEQGPTDAIPKTPAKTPAKVPVPSATKRNSEQSLASWAVLEKDSLAENGSFGMVDELRYSSDTQILESPAVVNRVSNGLNTLFLHSESQQSFPYSQYPNVLREPPDSEDEEDEVQAFVVKPQTLTKNSSKFRSLTEIATQPTLFTPTIHLTQNNSTKEEVANLFGRANKADEEEEDSDTESESDALANATSHIPMSRRAGTLLSKRG